MSSSLDTVDFPIADFCETNSEVLVVLGLSSSWTYLVIVFCRRHEFLNLRCQLLCRTRLNDTTANTSVEQRATHIGDSGKRGPDSNHVLKIVPKVQEPLYTFRVTVMAQSLH